MATSGGAAPVAFVEYFVQTRREPGVVRGGFQVPLGPSNSLEVAQVRAAFPYEGRFHLRAKVVPAPGEFYWQDLVRDDDAVPFIAPRVAQLKVTPLFETGDDGIQSASAAANTTVSRGSWAPVQPRPSSFPLSPAQWAEKRRAIAERRAALTGPSGAGGAWEASFDAEAAFPDSFAAAPASSTPRAPASATVPPVVASSAPPALAAPVTAGWGAAEEEDGSFWASSSSASSSATAPSSSSASAAASGGGGGAGAGIGEEDAGPFSLSKLRSAVSSVSSSTVVSSVGKSLGSFFKRAASAIEDALEAGSLPSEHARRHLLGWQSDLQTKFREGFEPHERLLFQLWEVLFPEDAALSVDGRAGGDAGAGLAPRPSPHWLAVGFEREDPVPDLRTSGILGIRVLLHAGVRNNALLRRMLQFHEGSSDEHFLVAITCFHLTRLIGEVCLSSSVLFPVPPARPRFAPPLVSSANRASLFLPVVCVSMCARVCTCVLRAQIVELHTGGELGTKRKPYYELFDMPDGFLDLVWVALVVLDVRWRKNRAHQSELGRVVAGVLESVRAWLDEGPRSIDGLRAIVQESEGLKLP